MLPTTGHQTGGGHTGLVIDSGRQSQRGHGVGGILSSLLRGATPMFKSLGKSLQTTGLGLVGDILSGENIKTSFKTIWEKDGTRTHQQRNKSQLYTNWRTA
jgi:hypothetical protein